jgi:diacylglycerol kinase family enzyme
LNARLSELAPAAPAIAAGTSAPACLIVNPLSFSASRGLAEQATALARSHHAEVVVVNGPAALTTAIESILTRRQQHVMVLAGDGTVCAIVNQLAHLPPGSWIPDLLVLPGGRSNLTAADMVPGGQALATMQLALERAREQRWDLAVEERCPLRIEQSPAPPQHGFFMAAAVIDSAIRQCHQNRLDNSTLRAGVSTVGYVLGLGVRAVFGRSGITCPTLRIDAGACGTQQGLVRLLLATTLLHRTGLLNPYAARGDGEVRVTAVSRDARSFWRLLPRLLTGRYLNSMSADRGYLSGRCDSVRVDGLAGYSLDGEAFDTDPSRPVVITAGPRLRFIRP